MRTIALSVTVCGLVLAITGISVGSDFDALLQDLSFGDAPTLNRPESMNVTVEQAEPLNLTVDQAAEALKPAPGGFLLPVETATDAAPPLPQGEGTHRRLRNLPHPDPRIPQAGGNPLAVSRDCDRLNHLTRAMRRCAAMAPAS